MTTQLASIGTLEPIPAHLEDRMRLVACHYGTDVEDRRALLWALGLVTVTDDPEPAPKVVAPATPFKATPGEKPDRYAPSRRIRMAAYNNTPDDTAAAHALGISRGAFSDWRRSHGLPLKSITATKAHSRREAYDATTCDTAAAALLGISRNVFATWRARAKLPIKTTL